MQISYAITVSSEIEEIRRLLNHLTVFIDTDDEIIVLVDVTKGFKEQIVSVCKEFSSLREIKTYFAEFNNHFADWKNILNSHCKGDWIFQIDADEIPSKDLILNLKTIIGSSNGMECIVVPRSNKIVGASKEDLQGWKFFETQRGINWPDYQWRIYKNDKEICWKGKVHERLSGFRKYSVIPSQQDIYKLDHEKTVERQKIQNNFYRKLIYEEHNSRNGR